MNARHPSPSILAFSRKAAIFAGVYAASLIGAQAQQGTPPQDGPLQPGEAVVTRFPGVASGGPQGATIDVNGPVAVVIGVRNPQEPPQGQHWLYKPIRTAATAGQVGQVFGVALDDQNPPNIYLTATAAFGLHYSEGGWMQGMWGPGGGPGTVWRLDAASGYRNARPFADIRPNGRPNSAAALGNIAYDRINRQFFVTDMETGLIHRIGLDGRDGGAFDHGATARPQFTDAESRQPGSLPPIPFDPQSAARFQDCPGAFERTPECWNIAASGRRVWGVGVRRDPMGQGARLYYGVWSGPDFGNAGWQQLSDEEKRNSVWSVRLGPDGQFDPSDVRREFIMPDFFTAPQDIARAGYSRPVSDISFSECGERPVMLVSERGGLRNLGLTSENAFATPGEARTLRYELDQNGAWRAVGRYDVGNNDRQQQGAPFIRANCAGGAAFGPDVADGQSAQGGGPDRFVWITGDNLCSPQGPCRLPGSSPGQSSGQQTQPQQASQQGEPEPQADPSHVHGLQGHSADLLGEVSPSTAYGATPPQGETSPALERAYLIDVDTVIDPTGAVIEQELLRNDATHVGDVAVFQLCPQPPAPQPPARAGLPWVNPAFLIPPPPAGFVVPGHSPSFSHAQWSSHGTRTSHFRYGSHNPAWSHQRWRSHYTLWSHNPRQSHNPRWSHNRIQSHNRWISTGHDPRRSHEQYRSHATAWSHNPRISQGHQRNISTGHDRRASWHNPRLSQGHDPRRSQGHNPQVSDGHNPQISQGHNPQRSQGHNPVLSRGGPVHNPAISAGGLHNQQQSRGHNPVASRGPVHNPAVSRSQQHNPAVSRGHNPVASRGPVHNPAASRGPVHRPSVSRGPVHSPAASRGMRSNAPPRVQQPRIQQPRVQQPRVQQRHFQQPRMQQPRFQQPRMQQRQPMRQQQPVRRQIPR